MRKILQNNSWLEKDPLYAPKYFSAIKNLIAPSAPAKFFVLIFCTKLFYAAEGIELLIL